MNMLENGNAACNECGGDSGVPAEIGPYGARLALCEYCAPHVEAREAREAREAYSDYPVPLDWYQD